MSAPYFPKFVRRPFFQWLHIILLSKRSSLVMVTSQKTLKICFLSFVVTMALVFFLVLSLHRVILSPKQGTIILLLKPFLCIISKQTFLDSVIGVLIVLDISKAKSTNLLDMTNPKSVYVCDTLTVVSSAEGIR